MLINYELSSVMIRTAIRTSDNCILISSDFYPCDMQIAYEEIPHVCSPCLGAKDVKIMRDSTGDECRICRSVFVTFQWTPPSHRTRSTIICKRCAESNDACQSCINDIKYHIDLPIRKAALRILEEEGGNDSQKSEVLEKVSERFGPKNIKLQQSDSKIATLRAIINRFPLPDSSIEDNVSSKEVKNENGYSDSCNDSNLKHDFLCVYGIEEDFDINALRSYLKASIEHIDSNPAGRYAFITFSPDQPPIELPVSYIIDGRRLIFAWGKRVSVPGGLQRHVGAIVRSFLREYRN